MDVAKAHLLATVVATQCTALLAGSVPYFPIEVSRTIASGPLPTLVFRLGVWSLGLSLCWTRTLTWNTAALWLSVVWIAEFDDVRHWALHMMGVGMLFAACTFSSVQHRGTAALLPLGAAFTIYVLRILLKLAAVLLFLVEEWPMSNGTPSTTLVNVGRVGFDKSMDIMYRGAVACPRSYEHVLPMFKLGGVLQWAAFYALSFAF